MNQILLKDNIINLVVIEYIVKAGDYNIFQIIFYNLYYLKILVNMI